MKFMCLVYFDDTSFAGMSEADLTKLTDDTIAEDHDLRRRGKLILAQPLQGPETAVSVRVRAGKMQRTDGPFAETKEWLGGFMLIDAVDIDEAVAIASEGRIPAIGRIKIRPVLVQVDSRTGQGRPELETR